MKHILTLAALVFATSCFGQEACSNVHDINSNGTIDIEDFLSILGLFADVDVDEDGVWDSQDDCLDATACNYLASPTEPCGYLDALGECGGACEGDGDGDGICDDVDTCVGELDECGVCNGPGPTEVVIEDINILYDSVYAEQIDEWWVFEVGADTTFSFECLPLFACGDPVSYQGYDYATVLIGDQCWFAENLRSENYENGDEIPSNLSGSEWGNTSSGAVAVYGEESIITCQDWSPDGDACDETWSLNEYGRLYNWHAVSDQRGVCPSGWKVPTLEEWNQLEEFVGTDSAGTKLKSEYGWVILSTVNLQTIIGEDAFGFKALPSGGISSDGYTYYDGGNATSFWTSTFNDNGSNSAYRKALASAAVLLYGGSQPINVGNAVRCILDSE